MELPRTGKRRGLVEASNPDAITSITNDEVRIDQTREHLTGAPVYDPDLVQERDTYGSILDHYGYGPFWGPDYRYPDYPNYRH